MSKRGMSAADWLGHVVGWRKSGLSQAAYGALHGLRAKSLSNWVCRFNAGADGSSGVLARSQLPTPPLTMVQAHIQRAEPGGGVAPTCAPASGEHGTICLRHPSGWVMEWPACAQASLLEWARAL
jgi:hypothetical protein